MEEELREEFVIWDDVSLWAHDFHESVAFAQSHKKPFAESRGEFDTVAVFAQQLGQHYGTWQNLECEGLKSQLVEMEYRGTGRVKLSDFYKPAALDGSWTFQESVGYLRALGLLDESDPSQPSVIIANYITSQSNCIASSGYYSVCCKNECESLLGHLEENIGASEAKPAAIVSLISKLPSSTVATPQPGESLLQRLNDIAATHGGKVPLHSRLFAQWMHHIYPRECPYPHLSGTTDTQSEGEFLDESGMAAQASEEEMMQYISLPQNTTHDNTKSDLAVEAVFPWSSEEELFVVRAPTKEPTPWESAKSSPSTVRSAVLLAAAGSLAFSLIQTMKGSLGTTDGKPASLKYLV